MLLNLAKRWIFSSLESVPSPMVDDWTNCATANGCTPEQIEQAAAMANELYPPYDLPVCRQYAHRWDAPFHGAGFALVYCEMDITHVGAAQKDPRLVIFASSDAPVGQELISAYSGLIAQVNMDALAAAAAAGNRQNLLSELLAALTELHVKFSATE